MNILIAEKSILEKLNLSYKDICLLDILAIDNLDGTVTVKKNRFSGIIGLLSLDVFLAYLKERSGNKHIHDEYIKLMAESNRLEDEILILRQKCTHPKIMKIACSSGNYDPSADAYWYEFQCPDCGKQWSEPR